MLGERTNLWRRTCARRPVVRGHEGPDSGHVIHVLLPVNADLTIPCDLFTRLESPSPIVEKDRA
jgi:hypothetical protein